MPQNTITRKRRKANRLGHWAEFKACCWLVLTGHRIVETRYKTPCGEIDIIARKSGLIIMVEVKARKTERDCIEAVTITAQKRIHNAADLWLGRQRKGELMSVRFDIIAIMPWRLPKHFTNMF